MSSDHRYPIALAVLALLPACGSTSPYGDRVASVLESAAALSKKVATWRAGLTGSVGDLVMRQLGDYGADAGGLAKALVDASAGLQDAAQEKLAPVHAALGRLGAFKLDDLLELTPVRRQEAIDSFAKHAAQLGELAGS